MTTASGPTAYDALLGARIAEARSAAALTQSDVAERMNLTRSSISNIEAGRQRVLAATVMLFGDVLGVDPRWLLVGPYAPRSTPPPRGLSRTELDRLRRGIGSLRAVADTLNALAEVRS